MKKILIVYASQTGNTERVVGLIASAFGEEKVDVKPVSELHGEDIANYPYLILGSPTWGSGEYHDDYFVFVRNRGKNMDLSGKKVALFGLGDQKYYGDTFVNGMGQLYDWLVETHAEIVGQVPVDGYEFNASEAVRDGMFVGLPLDEDNQDELTEERIEKWVGELKKIFV